MLSTLEQLRVRAWGIQLTGDCIPQEAQRAGDAPLVQGGSFAQYLQDWVQNNGQLPPQGTAALAEVCSPV